MVLVKRPIQSDELAGRRELATMLGSYWIYLHAAERAVRRAFGEVGLRALGRAFRRFGIRRGQYMRDLPEIIAAGRTVRALCEHWDVGELTLAACDAALVLTVADDRFDAIFMEVPGRDYFATRPGADILGVYWAETLEGIRIGYDESLVLESTPACMDAGAGWRFSLRTTDGEAAGKPIDAGSRMRDPAERIRLIRRTIGTLGALVTSVGRELRQEFDGAGEAVFREIAYNFGAARGSAIRGVHESEGKPLDFESFFGGIQERDRAETTFVYRGERHISRGVTHLDCTYCPLAEVWAAEGHEGLELAYLFDLDNHRGLIESYNPHALVRWDTVKSRGDSVCKFRFVIPELVTDDDPEWAQAFRSRPVSG